MLVYNKHLLFNTHAMNIKVLNAFPLLHQPCIAVPPHRYNCVLIICTAVQCSAVQCSALHCTALHYTTLHCTTLHYTTLHCTALHCTALHCTTLHCTALHCTTLHCTALHSPAVILYASLLEVPASNLRLETFSNVTVIKI